MSNPTGSNHSPPIRAHIDTLPVEVFQKILAMALPPTYFTAPTGREIPVLNGPVHGLRSETFNLPIHVSQVSSRWRKLALDHGELWSYLCIDFSPVHLQWAVKALDTFLERTNGSPLNFGFTCDLRGVTDPQTHETGSRIVVTLLKEQRRWRDVRFRWSNLNLPDDFPDLEITDTPLLTSLYLETYLYGRNKGQYWANVSSIPPQIRRLTLRGYFVPAMESDHLPELQSCTLDFHYEPPESPIASTFLNFLKAAPNLRQFVCNSGFEGLFSMMFDEEPAPELINPAVDHNKLESLEIVALRNSEGVAELLRLPALKRLVYEDGSGHAAQTLLNLIRRSDPPLTFLELRSGSVDEVVLLDVLRLLPSLETLYLSGFAVSERFFQALGMKDESSVPRLSPAEHRFTILPHLKSLRLQWLKIRNLEASTDALLSAIDSRYALNYFDKINIGYGSRLSPLPLTETDHGRVKKELKDKGTIIICGQD